MTQATQQTSLQFASVKWDDDDQVAAFIEQCVQEKEDYNGVFERQAQMNMAWYLGYQYLGWDNTLNGLRQFPVRNGEENRPRLVYNHIMPKVEALVSWVGRDEIEFEVLPATDDQGDEDTARISTSILQYYQELLNYDTLSERCDRSMFITGDGFIKVCWDAFKGGTFDAAAALEMDAKEFKKVYKSDPNVTLGDVDCYSVDPKRVFWGPAGAMFEDKEYLLELNERSVAYVCERYDVKPDDITGANLKRETMLYRSSDIGNTGVAAKHKDRGESVIVAELWVKSSTLIPGGRHAVYCGGKTLRNDKNAYKHQEIPYIQFKSIELEDRPHGACYVDNLLGPQSDYNRNMNQQCENRELMANPYFQYQRGSIQRFDQWNNRPGGLREYIGNAPPTLQQGAAMPAVTLAQLSQTEKSMQDIIGVHNPSMGKAEPGAKSGRAIIALQEKDENRLERMLKRRRNGHGRLGRLILATVAQYVTEERLIKITSQEDETEYLRFKGDMLVGKHQGPGIDYYDVRVTTSGMPRSRAVAIDIAEMLTRNQALQPATNPNDRDVLFKLLEMGPSKTIDPKGLDRRNARLENDILRAGQWVAPRDFDDHDLHLREHEKYEKRGFFRKAPPQIQAAHLAHRQEHMKLMAMKSLQPQLIMQQVAGQVGLLPQGPAGGNGNGRAAAAGGAAPGNPRITGGPGPAAA